MPDEFDMYSEVAFVSIGVIGDAKDWRFETLVDTIDIDTGDKDFESMATIAGGRLVKFTPQTDVTLTLEAYPTEAGTDADLADNGVATGFWDLQNSGSGDSPMSIPLDLARNKVRVVILFIEPNAALAAINATSAIAGGTTALRIIMADGYVTGAKPAFTDDELKWTVTIKFPAFDRRGFTAADGHNVLIESSNAGALAAITNYTTTNKFS